jgi:ubiquinone/menaquinone biosynthesis C-methylase UbiE
MNDHHTCPVWVGYVLANPLRALFQNPQRILGPHITPGMQALDVGSAMGFFSLPLARLVGPDGRVVCVDLQQKMLDSLLRRARRANLRDRIEARLSTADSLCIPDLRGQIHFALLFAVIHEMVDPARVFSEVRDALRPKGRVLIAEPRMHVQEDAFRESISLAERCGLRQVGSAAISWARAALLANE